MCTSTKVVSWLLNKCGAQGGRGLKQEERAEIRRTVLYCRSVLEEEFDERLRLVGFLANRTLPADRLPADRREIRQQLDLAFERENLP